MNRRACDAQGAGDRSWAEVRPKRLREHRRADDAESGASVVLVPRFGGGWLDRALRPFRLADHRLRLDGPGSLVWELSDGMHTVREIGRALDARFGDGVAPVEERLPRFLADLARRRLVELT